MLLLCIFLIHNAAVVTLIKLRCSILTQFHNINSTQIIKKFKLLIALNIFIDQVVLWTPHINEFGPLNNFVKFPSTRWLNHSQIGSGFYNINEDVRRQGLAFAGREVVNKKHKS